MRPKSVAQPFRVQRPQPRRGRPASEIAEDDADGAAVVERDGGGFAVEPDALAEGGAGHPGIGRGGAAGRGGD